MRSSPTHEHSEGVLRPAAPRRSLRATGFDDARIWLQACSSHSAIAGVVLSCKRSPELQPSHVLPHAQQLRVHDARRSFEQSRLEQRRDAARRLPLLREPLANNSGEQASAGRGGPRGAESISCLLAGGQSVCPIPLTTNARRQFHSSLRALKTRSSAIAYPSP